MHRQHLHQTIGHYLQCWGTPQALAPYPSDLPGEMSRATEIGQFAEAHADCFERTCLPGHITGSALVVSKDLNAVLLTLHKKLGVWLQLGGHSDGDAQPHRVAMREALEESGLKGLDFLAYEHVFGGGPLRQDTAHPLPFDLDCHVIPARKTEPAHIHYDIRYVIVANQEEPIVISEESQDLRWFSLTEARTVTAEPSMLRQFAKLEWLSSCLRP